MKLSDGQPAYPSPASPPRAAPQSRVHEGWNSIISSWLGKQQRKDLKTSSAPEQKTNQASLSTLNPTQPNPRPPSGPGSPPRLCRWSYWGHLPSPAQRAPPGGSASWDNPLTGKPPGETALSPCIAPPC